MFEGKLFNCYVSSQWLIPAWTNPWLKTQSIGKQAWKKSWKRWHRSRNLLPDHRLKGDSNWNQNFIKNTTFFTIDIQENIKVDPKNPKDNAKKPTMNPNATLRLVHPNSHHNSNQCLRSCLLRSFCTFWAWFWNVRIIYGQDAFLKTKFTKLYISLVFVCLKRNVIMLLPKNLSVMTTLSTLL